MKIDTDACWKRSLKGTRGEAQVLFNLYFFIVNFENVAITTKHHNESLKIQQLTIVSLLIYFCNIIWTTFFPRHAL